MQNPTVDRLVVSRPRTIHQPRVDMYGPIHKALRWALARLMARLGSTNLTDLEAAEPVLVELDDILTFCEQHIRHEEAFIHPALEARRSGSTAGLGAAHVEHDDAVRELRFLSSTLRTTPRTAPRDAPNDGRSALARTLYLCFGAFVAETLAHMVEEEEVFQPLLEELYSDEELQSIHRAIIGSMPPAELVVSLRFLLPAITFEERIALLAEPKAGMPPAVFEQMFAAARTYVSDEDVFELRQKLEAA